MSWPVHQCVGRKSQLKRRSYSLFVYKKASLVRSYAGRDVIGINLP